MQTEFKVVDIHSHILFGIDDGAYNINESLSLIKLGYGQGIRNIFCTNHSYGMENKHQDYYKNLHQLKKEINSRYSDVRLYNGCEIMCNRNKMRHIINNINNKIYPTMNNTKNVLVEFDPYLTDGMDEMLYCLCFMIDKGFTPIIAHVERYNNIYDDPLKNLFFIKEIGCLLQINLFSVEQDKGNRKRIADICLSNNLIDFVGTDTHRLNYKPTEAITGARGVISKMGIKTGKEILFNNAKEILKI